MTEILEILFAVLTGLMVAYLVRHYVFTFAVLRKSARNKKSTITAESLAYQPSVSIMIPAHNEERVIERLLQRLTELTYPKDKMQIIIVDDASTDTTGIIAEQYAEINGHFRIVHRNQREGGVGKASALNAGLTHATGEVILCFDADYYPQVDIIERLVEKFSDPQVGVVQGRITVLNEPQNTVTRLVALERIGGYGVDQQARNDLGLITQFGGTVGGVRHALLKELGGWDESILAEDTDLTFRVYLAGYKVCYVPTAECYEEAVESWRDYRKQRYRWARGHMQCAFKHWLEVLRSNKLNFKEKIDGILLLNTYFMPILVLLSWIVGVPLFFIKSSPWFTVAWASMPISLYSFVGNFAPFFEVGIGTYLDGRRRAQWLIPLLLFTFLINMQICSEAFLDLVTSKILRKNNSSWVKTAHSGNGNNYISS